MCSCFVEFPLYNFMSCVVFVKCEYICCGNFHLNGELGVVFVLSMFFVVECFCGGDVDELRGVWDFW